MGDINPRSFAFGSAFHCPPKLPLSWFARVIARASCQGLIIWTGTSTLPLFLLLNIISLQNNLTVNLKFLHFATLLAVQSNFANFAFSAFKLLDGSNFVSSMFKVQCQLLVISYLWRNCILNHITLKFHQLHFHVMFIICCPNSRSVQYYCKRAYLDLCLKKAYQVLLF